MALLTFLLTNPLKSSITTLLNQLKNNLIFLLGVFRGGKKDSRAFGQNSIERSLHSQRISNKIACYYSREYQIPDKPKKNSFAASFTDPDFKVIAISFEEFGEVEESETKSKIFFFDFLLIF